MSNCTTCGDLLLSGARFCIICGRAVAATGQTERLTASPQGSRYPLGLLRGEWVYEETSALYNDPEFIRCLPWWMHEMVKKGEY